MRPPPPPPIWHPHRRPMLPPPPPGTHLDSILRLASVFMQCHDFEFRLVSHSLLVRDACVRTVRAECSQNFRRLWRSSQFFGACGANRNFQCLRRRLKLAAARMRRSVLTFHASIVLCISQRLERGVARAGIEKSGFGRNTGKRPDSNLFLENRGGI